MYIRVIICNYIKSYLYLLNKIKATIQNIVAQNLVENITRSRVIHKNIHKINSNKLITITAAKDFSIL